MIRKGLTGTYWLCAIKDGARIICKCSKPPKRSLDGISWICQGEVDMGFLCLDTERYSPIAHRQTRSGDVIYAAEFKDLDFPEITYGDEPIEIEIVESGKIYTY